MFKYENKNLIIVDIGKENPYYAKILQEQLSIINLGLKISIQFMLQGYKTEDEELKKLLLKLSAEELSNYELINQVINLLSGENIFKTVYSNEEIALTGDVCTDLLSNITLLEQSKSIYSGLEKKIDDPKIKEILSFIIKREETFSSELREAFNKIQRRKIKEEYKTNKESRICFSTIKPKLKESAYEEFKNTPPTYRW